MNREEDTVHEPYVIEYTKSVWSSDILSNNGVECPL